MPAGRTRRSNCTERPLPKRTTRIAARHDVRAAVERWRANRLALAERVRTLMAQQNFSEAAALLDEREHDRRPLSGELALLQIQGPIVEWQAARRQPQTPLPAPLRQQLEQRANRLRRDVGGYWSLRADLALQQMREVEQYGAVLANLAGRAQAAFNAGRPDEAIELYGEAAAQAHHENRGPP